MSKTTWRELVVGDQLFNPQYIGLALEVASIKDAGTPGELVVSLSKKGATIDLKVNVVVTIRAEEKLSDRGFTFIGISEAGGASH